MQAKLRMLCTIFSSSVYGNGFDGAACKPASSCLKRWIPASGELRKNHRSGYVWKDFVFGTRRRAARSAGEGTRDLEPGPALDTLPSAQAFAKRYKARFNQDVELYAPFAYDAALAMIKAIQNSNSLDRAKIVASMPKVTVTGVTGNIAFDPHGDLIKPPYTLFEVQQGQWKSQRTVGGNGV
jgi:hypothetical protein